MNTNIKELYKKKYLKYKAKYLNLQRGGVFSNGRNHPNYQGVIDVDYELPKSITVNGEPGFIVLDDKGNVLVVDKKNNCVKVFDMRTGNLIGQINAPHPTSITKAIAFAKVDGKTKLYIAYHDYICFYDYVIEVKTNGPNLKTSNKKKWQCPKEYIPINSIAIKDKVLFICGNNAILSLDENQKLKVMISSPPDPAEIKILENLFSIAFDRDGNLVVADIRDHRIQVFDKDNKLLRIIGREGTGVGEFYFPNDFALGMTGNIIVADTGNNRVQIFNYKTGVIISKKSITQPKGVAIDGNGRILVSIAGVIQVLNYKDFNEDVTPRIEKKDGKIRLPQRIKLIK